VSAPWYTANHINPAVSKFIFHWHPPYTSLLIRLTCHILVLPCVAVNKMKIEIV
jgi:hypothetical protein